MPVTRRVRATFALAALSMFLAACGGGSESDASLSAAPSAADDRAYPLKGGDCIGSCSGGGGTPVPGATNPLPTTPPAPDILYRESFGPGPQQLRPKGGKGDMRSAFLHTTIGGFWVEWPGAKGTQWITANGDQSWKFAGAGNNPYELPSPLQSGSDFAYEGVAYSETFDVLNPVYPALLLPVGLPTTPWALSVEATPQGGNFASYVALGLTDSSATASNLTTVGKVALILRRPALNSDVTWELWSGVGGQTLLGSGPVEDLYYNHLVLAYDPLRQLLTASVNETVVGSFNIDLGSPRYAGIEGLGMADNFVIRSLGSAAQQ